MVDRSFQDIMENENENYFGRKSVLLSGDWLPRNQTQKASTVLHYGKVPQPLKLHESGSVDFCFHFKQSIELTNTNKLA